MPLVPALGGEAAKAAFAEAMAAQFPETPTADEQAGIDYLAEAAGAAGEAVVEYILANALVPAHAPGGATPIT